MTSQLVPAKVMEPKDPGDITPYGIDWANGGPNDAGPKDTGWLQGEVITASVWTVPAGITNDAEGFDATMVTIVLSGGNDEIKYDIVNRITTASGYSWGRTIRIPVNTR